VSHLDALIAKAKIGQLVLLVGVDLSRDAAGLPSGAELARGLAARHNLPPSDSLAAVAQPLKRRHQQFRYITYLQQQLPAGGAPGALHQAITALPLPFLMTAAYDDRLTRALAAAGRPANLLVEDGDLAQRQHERPDLIKLCGDLGRLNTLVVAEDDYTDLLLDNDRRSLFDRVGEWLQQKTVLLVGCDPAQAGDFANWLYPEVLKLRGAFDGGGYLVCSNPAAEDVARWAGRNVTLIDAEPLAFLASLAEGLAGVAIKLPLDEEMAVLQGLVQMLRGTPSREQVAAKAATVPETARLKAIRVTFNLKLSDGDTLRAALDVDYDPDIDEYDGEFKDIGITLTQLRAWSEEAAKLRRKWQLLQRSAVEQKGLDLFDAILPPGSEERRMYTHALYLAQTFADVLYIVFDLGDEHGRLSQAPWELLHDGRVDWEGKIRGRGFLGLKYPVYRRLPTVASPGQVIARIQKALVVTADPTGRLEDLAAEVDWLVAALQAAGVAQVDVRRPTDADVNDPEAIKDLIRSGGYHLLHFTGHGQFNAADPPQSHLVLGLAGVPDVRLTAAALAEAGRDSGLTLVFLSACELGATAEAQEGRPWEEEGVVDALMQAGVPATIGMRWKVGDGNSRKLAETFYTQLLGGEPIERALMIARQAVENEPDWANPVLTKRHGVL